MKILLQLHSYWAFLLLIIMLTTLVRYAKAIMNERSYDRKDLHLAIYSLIFSGIQVLLGFAYYFSSPAYKYMAEHGISAALSKPEARIFAIEHPLMMMLSFITIWTGFNKHKKTSGKNLHRLLLIYYSVAFLMILWMIPWGQWLFDK